MRNINLPITKFGFALFVFVLAACSSSPKRPETSSDVTKVELKDYDYARLRLLDLDEMEDTVRSILREAAVPSEDDEAPNETNPEVVLQATKFIFSRPDIDNMREKLLKLVRADMSNTASFDENLSRLTDYSMNGLFDKSRSTVSRSTDFVILDNILSEIHPTMKTNPVHREIVRRLRDAEIEIPEDVTRDRNLRSMLRVVSPSQRAEKMYKEVEKLEKQQKQEARNKN